MKQNHSLHFEHEAAPRLGRLAYYHRDSGFTLSVLSSQAAPKVLEVIGYRYKRALAGGFAHQRAVFCCVRECGAIEAGNQHLFTADLVLHA